jgi:SAM-dependent methyltransferase
MTTSNETQATAAPTLPPAAGRSADPAYIAWKDWAPNAFGHCEPLDAAYFNAEVPIDDCAHARVLELGFGNGAFLAYIHELGVEAYGVERNPILVERARQLLGDKRAFSTLAAAELDAQCGTFSHIVAFDVLEHIPETEYPALFHRLGELLAPGGRCTLRFPNGDSPFGRAIQHGDPTHVTTIGTGKLVYFAQRAGLKVEVVRAPATPTANVGLRRALRRRIVLAARFVIEYVIGQIYFGRRILLDQNCTVVLSHE